MNYNGWRDTLECVRSLREDRSLRHFVLVIDNGSTDESVSALQSRLVEDEKLIKNPRNYGFAGGVNVGLQECLSAGCEYAFVLNNDTIIEPGVLAELVDYMDAHGDVAVCGPRVNSWADPATPQFTRYEGISEPVEDYISGCAFLLRLSSLNAVGPLDESYFIYWEEIDLWRRIATQGYKIMYVPTRSKVLHKGGASISNIGGNATYYLCRNEFLYFRRHHPSAKTLLRIISHQVFSFFAARTHLSFRIRAIRDGLALWLRNPATYWRGNFAMRGRQRQP